MYVVRRALAMFYVDFIIFIIALVQQQQQQQQQMLGPPGGTQRLLLLFVYVLLAHDATCISRLLVAVGLSVDLCVCCCVRMYVLLLLYVVAAPLQQPNDNDITIDCHEEQAATSRHAASSNTSNTRCQTATTMAYHAEAAQASTPGRRW